MAFLYHFLQKCHFNYDGCVFNDGIVSFRQNNKTDFSKNELELSTGRFEKGIWSFSLFL